MEHSPTALHNHHWGLAAVNELAEALTLGQGVDAVIETALNQVVALMDADVGAIYLFDKETTTLKLRASQGSFSPDLLLVLTSPESGENFMRCLLETGHAIAVEDVRTAGEISPELSQMLSRHGFISWVCAPLKMEGDVIGAYQLGKRSKRSFNADDMALLEIIGNVVGSSLSNAQLLRDLRNKESELRRALRRAVELQEDERKRVARELHDEVGQALTSILIRLKTLQEEEDNEAISDRLDDLRTLTAQTIEGTTPSGHGFTPCCIGQPGYCSRPSMVYPANCRTHWVGYQVLWSRKIRTPSFGNRINPVPGGPRRDNQRHPARKSPDH